MKIKVRTLFISNLQARYDLAKYRENTLSNSIHKLHRMVSRSNVQNKPKKYGNFTSGPITATRIYIENKFEKFTKKIFRSPFNDGFFFSLFHYFFFLSLPFLELCFLVNFIFCLLKIFNS